MNNTYYIFGLNVCSAISLPALPIMDRPLPSGHDVVIEYGATPEKLLQPQYQGRRFQAAPGEFLIRMDSVARIYVTAGCRIVMTPETGATEENLRMLLTGSAFGALLYQRNYLLLHACAISKNGRSTVIAGPSGIGKSTLTAGLHNRGYPFLDDDICAIRIIDGQPAAVPGFLRIKLWSDVLQELNTGTEQLVRFRRGKGMEKYSLSIPTMMGEKPVPIKSVFILETTPADRFEIRTLEGREKIKLIIKNAYRIKFLNGLGGKECHFQQCSAVALKASVYCIARPAGEFKLNELMDILESHF